MIRISEYKHKHKHKVSIQTVQRIRMVKRKLGVS